MISLDCLHDGINADLFGLSEMLDTFPKRKAKNGVMEDGRRQEYENVGIRSGRVEACDNVWQPIDKKDGCTYDRGQLAILPHRTMSLRPTIHPMVGSHLHSKINYHQCEHDC